MESGNVVVEIACSNCQALLVPGDGERARGAMVCPHCTELALLGTELELLGTERALQDGGAQRRSGHARQVARREGDHGLEFEKVWLSSRSLIPLVFLLIWLALVVTWYVFVGPQVLAYGSWRSLFNIFPLLCTVAILAFTYYVLARLFNRTRVVLGAQVTVRVRPFPLVRGQAVPGDALERFACRQKSVLGPNERRIDVEQGVTYDLEVLHGGGQRLTLIQGVRDVREAVELLELARSEFETRGQVL